MPTDHKYLEMLEDLDSLKDRMENFIGAINILKQKLKQHHKTVTELNERNSVDEGVKSCFQIGIDMVGDKAYCSLCSRNIKETKT